VNKKLQKIKKKNDKNISIIKRMADNMKKFHKESFSVLSSLKSSFIAEEKI